MAMEKAEEAEELQSSGQLGGLTIGDAAAIALSRGRMARLTRRQSTPASPVPATSAPTTRRILTSASEP